MVTIIPNFTMGRMSLICGDVGPFQPNFPVEVPLWMALALRQAQLAGTNVRHSAVSTTIFSDCSVFAFCIIQIYVGKLRHYLFVQGETAVLHPTT